MITAPLYILGFGIFAAFYWLTGNRPGARAVFVIVAALPVMWLAVSQSAWWPLWGATLWAAVGAAIWVTLRHQGVIFGWVAILVELAALSYLLVYLGVHFALATTASNAFGIVAVLIAGGPTWRALIDDPGDTLSAAGRAVVGVARFGVGGGG